VCGVCFGYIVLESGLNLGDAFGDILGGPLDKHFYRAVGQVSYKSFEHKCSCYSAGCVSKAYTLDSAIKYNMHRCLSHKYIINVKIPKAKQKKYRIQNEQAQEKNPERRILNTESQINNHGFQKHRRDDMKLWIAGKW